MYNSELEAAKSAINEARVIQLQQQAQAKAQYDDCAQQASTGGIGRRVTLAETLEETANGSYSTGASYSRAANILRQHPEFEDLIWLIRSGLI